MSEFITASGGICAPMAPFGRYTFPDANPMPHVTLWPAASRAWTETKWRGRAVRRCLRDAVGFARYGDHDHPRHSA